ncbi:hypothetical protein E7T06_14810 [Deinococcus sp. Arct2-2]|uniref:hypothetical protein n=1 Tax=Deinococcus sp. Arct2-2 TaxID=2568653 RepID=UPI0010A2BC56|nr:hypothetical protein [Deinococcus sp. Arct2-2]THF68828.1 hypothetical protein E7T06_14810 [Deinococcus sp. Arct2-2]
MTLAALQAAVSAGDDVAALALLCGLQPTPAEAQACAVLALHLGRPSLAVQWATDSLTRAAALLRLGHTETARQTLAPLPDSPRVALLLARFLALESGAQAMPQATHARALARAEGDAAALTAAATLLGELLLPTDPRAALRTLAEGLKVAEMAGEAADAHLLAVLAHVQAAVGGAEKARRTAEKALGWAALRSPARVVALLALGQSEQAYAEASAGELDERWLLPFILPPHPTAPDHE